MAFQWAHEFKIEVYRLVGESPTAPRDFKYRDQLFEAASSVESNIAEGFARFVPGEFRTFLRYSLASLAEAVVRVRDGADRGHFTAEATTEALRLGELCRQSTQNLRASLRRSQ